MHLPIPFHYPIESIDRQWKQESVAQWVVFLCSIVIGFLTHIFIDSFTHANGYFVTQLQFLRLGMGGLPVYKWLQYGLSLVGLLFPVVLCWQRGWISFDKRQSWHGPITKKQKAAYWILAVGTAMVVFGLKLLLGSHDNGLGFWLWHR